MKLTLCACALLSCLSPLPGQSFLHYPDDNMGTSYATPAGWYPWFTNVTGSREQIIVPASAFAGLPPGVPLASLGFFAGASSNGATATYTIMQVRLGPAGGPGLTATFDTNLPPATATLVLDAPGTMIAPQAGQGAWVDLPFNFSYPSPGVDLCVDVQTQIASGSGYLRSSVSSAVGRCFAGTYTGQATGSISTGSGYKVRFGLGGLGQIEYQVNQPAANAEVNATPGTSITPAAVTFGVGQLAVLALSSTQAGVPWDIAFGLAPLVPVSGGALTLAGGEILNVDVNDPTFSFLFMFFQGPGFANAQLPIVVNNPVSISLQMGVTNPAVPLGASLSQPTRITVQ